jgi:hypothetical protein
MEEIVPGDNPGPYPTSAYDLGYDQGGSLSLWRKASGALMDWTFNGARWFVKIGLWATNWSLEFKFADKLAAPAQRIADTYRTQVVERLGLERFFLVLAALYGGWLALRGRMARGASEFMLSILIVALAATVLSNPSRVLLDGLKFTSGLSYEVASLTASADPQAAPPSQSGNVAKPMLAAIHKAFVETPHEILNWGHQIPPGSPCRATYEAAVASGPWGPADEPRDAMKAAGCTTEANFNHDPSGDRVLGAFLVLLASILVMVLLMLVAGTLVAAQLGVVVALALSPFAFVAGALPGGGRVLLWRWVGGYLQALTGVVMMAVMLSLFLVGTSALLLATATDALIVQMGSIVVVVIIALIKRRRLLERGHRAVSHFTQRMSHARAGGGAGGGGRAWVGPAAAGAAIGFGADEVLDHIRRSHHQVRGAVDSHRRRQYQRVMVHGARQRGRQSSYQPGSHQVAPGRSRGGADDEVAGEGEESPPARRLASRLQETRSGRVAVAAAGGAALAAKATVGAPVYWPRWKSQASEAASARAEELRTQLAGVGARAGAFGREWVDGAKTPARGARTAWQGAQGMAEDAVLGSRLAASNVSQWAARARGPVANGSNGAGSHGAGSNGSAGENGASGAGPAGPEDHRSPAPRAERHRRPAAPGDDAPQRRPMARADGAVPRVGDVVSYREPGPSGATRRGRVVGISQDPTTDEAVPMVNGGTKGQTRPAPGWDRIVRGAPAPAAGDGMPRTRGRAEDPAAELDRRLGRRPGPDRPEQ